MNSKINEFKPIAYSCNGKIVTFNQPLIMAIVNITPDSFYDGGKYSTIDDVLSDVEEKIKNGAHIIDIGAASSRPKATQISESEELTRLMTFLPGIRRHFPEIIISVDTYRSTIARKCALEGVDMINDIGGGDLDKKMFETIATLNLPYVLMHIQGTPQTMQENPTYVNVVQDVKNALLQKIQSLSSLNFNKIIVDPGFGFGKTNAHNYQLLAALDEIKMLGHPVLTGVSRKSMVNQVIGTSAVTALNGTTVLNTIALLNGASILRVHDVTEARQAIELVQFYKNNNYQT